MISHPAVLPAAAPEVEERREADRQRVGRVAEPAERHARTQHDHHNVDRDAVHHRRDQFDQQRHAGVAGAGNRVVDDVRPRLDHRVDHNRVHRFARRVDQYRAVGEDPQNRIREKREDHQKRAAADEGQPRRAADQLQHLVGVPGADQVADQRACDRRERTEHHK